jgi:hypothetical protein
MSLYSGGTTDSGVESTHLRGGPGMVKMCIQEKESSVREPPLKYSLGEHVTKNVTIKPTLAVFPLSKDVSLEPNASLIANNQSTTMSPQIQRSQFHSLLSKASVPGLIQPV